MLQSDFWAPDLTAAAKACRETYPRETQETVALADDICKNRFTFRGHWEMEKTHEPVAFRDKIVWDQSPTGDPEWVYAFNRHSFLVTLGKAWRCTGDEKYPAAFARLITDWIDGVPLTEKSKSTAWRGIETGIRCENWLRALALFADSDALSGTLLEKMEASLRIHADWLLEEHRPFQKLSNWGVLQDHGLFLLGLAFSDKDWCDTAAKRLDEELHNQVMADGTHWEQSPMYHCEVLHCCLDSVLVACRAGYHLPDSFLARTHAMATALARMIRPDGLLLCQSDSDEIDARDLLELAALLFHDALLKGYAGENLHEENIWNIADKIDDYAAMEECSPCGSVALPDSGNYMLWDGKGPEAGFLHFHCGSLGSGHGHADLLHVDLVSRGESILSDSGRFTYVDSPIRKALKSPAAHNTIRVDGQDFSVYKDTWSYETLAEPLKGEYCFTPAADYVSGGHLGYYQNGVIPCRRVLRLGHGLWLLWDSFAVQGAQSHRYEHFYHFGPEGTAAIEGQGAVYSGKTSSARLLFCGAQVQLSLGKAPLSREYNRMEQADCLCAAHTAAGFTSLATVIAVGGDSLPPSLQAQLLPVTLLASGKLLSPQRAQAIRITKDGQSWTVILSHREVSEETGLLSAGGCCGYGKVLVFGPDNPDGICLAW